MLQISTKGIQDYAWLGVKDDPLGIVQRIWPILTNDR